MVTYSGTVGLTLPPFLTKLRSIRHMRQHSRYLPILALLLAVAFLGAQFHFCADLSSAPVASHSCPVCSASIAVIAPTFSIAPLVIANRLEAPASSLTVLSHVPRAVSARAPPSL